jgi:hypothetical protein
MSQVTQSESSIHLGAKNRDEIATSRNGNISVLLTLSTAAKTLHIGGLTQRWAFGYVKLNWHVGFCQELRLQALENMLSSLGEKK